MKIIKAFTLLEMILVITIIGIISVSLMKMKDNTGNKNDIGREAVNVIYKEMNQYTKDFQRNKIWEDGSGNEHEITYLYINFNNDTETSITGNNLTIGNLYLYTGYNIIEDEEVPYTTGHFDGTTLITDLKYSAFQVLKGSDNHIFYTRNESAGDITSILIANNGKIYTGNFQNVNEYDSFNTENLIDGPIYKFLICGGYGRINPIGVISINAITRTTTLDRCESEKYAGINCDEFATCN